MLNFEKLDKNNIKRNRFAILFSQELKKLKRTQFNYIKILQKRKKVLTTQIRIDNVKLANFLYKRRIQKSIYQLVFINIKNKL